MQTILGLLFVVVRLNFWIKSFKSDWSNEIQKLKNRMFCPSHPRESDSGPDISSVGRFRKKYMFFGKSCDWFVTLLTGLIVKRKSKDENLWSLIHWFYRSVGQIGRPRHSLFIGKGSRTSRPRFNWDSGPFKDRFFSSMQSYLSLTF